MTSARTRFIYLNRSQGALKTPRGKPEGNESRFTGRSKEGDFSADPDKEWRLNNRNEKGWYHHL
jgi:hypothetical protein